MTSREFKAMVTRAEKLMSKIDGLHLDDLIGVDDETLGDAQATMARISRHAKESQTTFWTAMFEQSNP